MTTANPASGGSVFWSDLKRLGAVAVFGLLFGVARAIRARRNSRG